MRTLAVFTATFCLGACGMDDYMGMPAFEDHGAAMSELRTALEEHASALASAQTLSAMRSAEDEHRTAMDSGMMLMQGAMNRAGGERGMCGMNTARMMRDLAQERDEHHRRMNASQNMEEARAEEERHRRWMNEELGFMEDDHAMMRGMSGHMCCGR